MAVGFWYIPSFVRDWTTHEHFPRVDLPEYYEKAYQRLEMLAYWFFFGESPYLAGKGFEPMYANVVAMRNEFPRVHPDARTTGKRKQKTGREFR